MNKYPPGWTTARLVTRPDHRNQARWTAAERIAVRIIADLSGVSPDAGDYPEPADPDARDTWEIRRHELELRLEYKWAREVSIVEKGRGKRNT